jgi:hypothetical protein
MCAQRGHEGRHHHHWRISGRRLLPDGVDNRSSTDFTFFFIMAVLVLLPFLPFQVGSFTFGTAFVIFSLRLGGGLRYDGE